MSGPAPKGTGADRTSPSPERPAPTRQHPVLTLDRSLAFVLIAGTLLGFLVPLSKWPRSLGQDWKYFDSQSLVVRSIVLFYRRLPLHDPWVLGGMDIAANPQSRIFSPAVLFDILFAPFEGNLVFLVVYAILGALGAFRLARTHGVSKPISLVAALLYVNSTWFALHFCEGHIPFADFLLLPWIFYFLLNASKPASLFALGSLLTLFLLNGGMYPFIFSLILILGGLAIRIIDPIDPLRQLRPYWGRYALAVLALGLVAMAKVVPVLVAHAHRRPIRDMTIMPPRLVLRTFFDIRQTIHALPAGGAHRFHEYGCYIGVVAILVVAWAIWRFRATFLNENRGYFILMFVFFWAGVGWGGRFNPWSLFQAIPLINNAHVQSRLLLFVHLLLILVLARALDRIPHRMAQGGLGLILVVEALAATNYTWATSYRNYPGPDYTTTLIRSRMIDATEEDAAKPWNYFDGTKSSKETYEPAPPETRVRFRGEEGYRGELYTTQGSALLTVTERSPGRISFACDASEPSRIVINTNFLEGWRVERGDADVYPTDENLVGLTVPAGSETITLEYVPRYLGWILGSYAIGLALWIYVGTSFIRGHLATKSRLFAKGQ